MKKFVFLTILCLAVLYSCHSSIKGEGEIIEKEIILNPVKKITAKGHYRLICLKDEKPPRLVIETNKNLIENIKIDNSQEKLTLSEGKKVSQAEIYNIYVYNADFGNFEIHDSVTVEINSPLRINQMNISLFNQSKFLENNLVVSEIMIKATDNSKINLQGSGTKLDIKANKAADVSATFFTANNTHIMLSDVATAEINGKEKISGQIVGNSSLTLLGNPTKDIKQKDLAQIKYKQ